MSRALLLSGYDAQSHIYWREGLVRHLSNFDWSVFTLPPRYFNWRIRGNGLWWGIHARAEINKNYDLLLTTSMVDLATLRSLCPELVKVPTVVYFHENQFAYPDSCSNKNSNQNQLEAQITSIYTALSADKLIFNSHYNLQSFLVGVEQLLKKMPDFVPKGIASSLESKSAVLPVPLENSSEVTTFPSVENQSKFSIVWNHRWEWDKDPELLFEVIKALPTSLPIVFHIVGQSFRSQPDVFKKIRDLLEHRGWLGQWGFLANRLEYQRLLKNSEMVLSTAAHDFQGLSVLEAVQLGCIPLVPNRVVYPEYFPQEYLYDPEDASAACHKICGAVENYSDSTNSGIDGNHSLNDMAARFAWSSLKKPYCEALNSVLHQTCEH